MVLLTRPWSKALGAPIELAADGRFEAAVSCPAIARLLASSPNGRGQVDVVLNDPMVEIRLVLSSEHEGLALLSYARNSPGSLQAHDLIMHSDALMATVDQGADPCEVREEFSAKLDRGSATFIETGVEAAFFRFDCHERSASQRAARLVEADGQLEEWVGLWPIVRWHALREAGVADAQRVVTYARTQDNPEIGAQILLDAAMDDTWISYADRQEVVFDALREERYRATLSFGLRGAEVVARDRVLSSGDAVPEFSLEDGHVANNSIVGRKTLLYAWASYCKPCAVGLAALRNLEIVAGDDVHVITINVGDSDEEMATFSRSFGDVPGTRVRVPSEADAEYRKLFPVPLLPSFLLVDENGRVLATSGEVTLDVVIADLAKAAHEP